MFAAFNSGPRLHGHPQVASARSEGEHAAESHQSVFLRICKARPLNHVTHVYSVETFLSSR